MRSDDTLWPPRPRRTNRGCRFPPEVLTRDEVMRLMAGCSKGQWGSASGRSPRFSTRVACASGRLWRCRPRTSTSTRARSACAMVVRWLEARTSLGISRTSTVFCMVDGRRLESSYVRVMLLRLSSETKTLNNRGHSVGGVPLLAPLTQALARWLGSMHRRVRGHPTP